MMDKFFKPKSVAVIGASGKKEKVGFALVKNLVESDSVAVYPVTLNERDILGKKTFKSVLEIEEAIDLAVIAVRAEIVPQILEECGSKKIPAAIVISSGFKEAGSVGGELEEKISEIAKRHNISLLGPNCIGVIDANAKLNVSFSAQNPLPGKIAFLTQSGALGTSLIDWANVQGVGLSKLVSLGNEADLTEIEFLEFLENDPETSAILMYLESVKDGKKFLEVLSRITRQKPVVVIKAGMGGHGNLAVRSHTGALAPEADVFIAACKQAGAVTVSSLRGFFHLVKVLPQVLDLRDPVQRLIVLTNGGGPSVVAADLIDKSKSLSLSVLSEDMKERLRAVLPPMSAIGNPVDILGDALAERYDKALEILTQDENTDGILVIVTPQMVTQIEETAKVLAKYNEIASSAMDRRCPKIFPVLPGGSTIRAGREELIRSGLVYFTFPRDVVESLNYLAKGATKIKSPYGHHGKAETVSASAEMMNFQRTLSLLSEYGISVAGKFIGMKEELEKTLQELGDGPYAMKAISSAAVHKTEAGAVRLNIKNFGEASAVWEELWTAPSVIGKVEGILTQKMEKTNKEVIIGMKRNNTFGPAVIFGMGGIYAEAVKDIAMRIAPVGKEEALEMMREIKGIKILEGLRGQPPVDFDLLAHIIVNLSRLSLEHPEVREIDLNPVIVDSQSATVVDARVMV